MFKFVNLQSNEIEELEVEVANLREEIEKGAELAEVNDKEKYLQQMETELKQLRIALNKVETEYKASQKEAKALSSLIERIFDSIECDREIAKEIAGSKSIS